ncbi:MAG: hypothetical protein J0H92_07915 [Sphingobacteriales bacterium]|nr:hypothetical protein [Sphingobacteriales bacterium]OJW30081.1 MAG: hypothetical protein BGO54_00350 [Sphingobacteriales bacterium 46-32]
MKNWQFAIIAILALLLISGINNYLSKPSLEEIKYKAQQDSIREAKMIKEIMEEQRKERAEKLKQSPMVN